MIDPIDFSELMQKLRIAKVKAHDPRVLITPHISSASDQDRHGAINVFCANLRAHLGGRPLRNVVDWERGY